MHEIASVVAPPAARGKKMNKVAAPRSPNYTKAEKVLLMELVDAYKGVVENRTTDMTTSKAKDEAWLQLAESYNCQMINGVHRTAEQLRACWGTLKKHAKGSLTLDNRSLYRTGGGPPEPTNVDEFDLLAIKICPGQFDPIYNPVDDDADYILQVKKSEDVPDLSMTVESGELFYQEDAGDYDVVCLSEEQFGLDFSTSELFPSEAVKAQQRSAPGVPSPVASVQPPRGGAHTSTGAPNRNAVPPSPVASVRPPPRVATRVSSASTGTAPDTSSQSASTVPTTSFPVRTSYFNSPEPATKKRKVSDDLATMAEAKKNLALKQIEAIEAKDQRDKELHEILKREKEIDIKIKEATLRALERQ